MRLRIWLQGGPVQPVWRRRDYRFFVASWVLTQTPICVYLLMFVATRHRLSSVWAAIAVTLAIHFPVGALWGLWMTRKFD